MAGQLSELPRRLGSQVNSFRYILVSSYYNHPQFNMVAIGHDNMAASRGQRRPTEQCLCHKDKRLVQVVRVARDGHEDAYDEPNIKSDGKSRS